MTAPWMVRAHRSGDHVHVSIRVPGPRDGRPLAGVLVVGIEHWPELIAVLEKLPGVEIIPGRDQDR